MDAIKFRLKVFILILLVIIGLGTVGLARIEHISTLDSFYFCVVTIATVGYGDIHPLTATGKMMSLLLIVTGVGTFLGLIANLTEMMLSKREREQKMKKLHVIVGVFFSEFGTAFLRSLSGIDADVEDIRSRLIIKGTWLDKDFFQAGKRLSVDSHLLVMDNVDLPAMRDHLQEKSVLVLRLLENPYLLEHESFTELLRAILHLKEELVSRKNLAGLPHSDRMHLAGDIRRVYGFLIPEWLEYMRYLKNNYPYLFSLAVRLNPFDPEATVEVT